MAPCASSPRARRDDPYPLQSGPCRARGLRVPDFSGLVNNKRSRPPPPDSPHRSPAAVSPRYRRSEEHTSELQSRPHLVCRLLLEKKKHKVNKNYTTNTRVMFDVTAQR